MLSMGIVRLVSSTPATVGHAATAGPTTLAWNLRVGIHSQPTFGQAALMMWTMGLHLRATLAKPVSIERTLPWETWQPFAVNVRAGNFKIFREVPIPTVANAPRADIKTIQVRVFAKPAQAECSKRSEAGLAAQSAELDSTHNFRARVHAETALKGQRPRPGRTRRMIARLHAHYITTAVANVFKPFKV